MVVYRQSAPSNDSTSTRKVNHPVLVELTISWEEQVIRVEHLQPNQRFYLRSSASEQADSLVFDPPDVLQHSFPWTLIEPGGHGVQLTVPPGTKYRVCPMDPLGEDAQELWPERDTHNSLGLELSEQQIVQCRIGKFLFTARLLPNHAPKIARSSMDKPMRNSLLASLIAVTSTLASTFAFAGEMPPELEQPSDHERLAELVSISSPPLTPDEAADFARRSQEIERIQRAEIHVRNEIYACGCGTGHSEENAWSLRLFDLLGPNRIRAIDAFQRTMRDRTTNGMNSLHTISSQTNEYSEFQFPLTAHGGLSEDPSLNTLRFGSGTQNRTPYWRSDSGRGWVRYGGGSDSEYQRPRYSSVNIQGGVTGDPLLAGDLTALTRRHSIELTDCFDSAQDYEPTVGGSLRVRIERLGPGVPRGHLPSSDQLHSDVVQCVVGVLRRLPYAESTNQWKIDYQLQFSLR